MTLDRSWLSQIRTYQEANINCLERVITKLPSIRNLRLKIEVIFEKTQVLLCNNILQNGNVRHDIDKKLYVILESKINDFEKYVSRNIKSNNNIRELFDQWSNQNENFAHKPYKQFITKRVENKTNYRDIASKP